MSQSNPPSLCLKSRPPQDSRTGGFAKADGSEGRRTPEHGGMVSSSDQARSCARSIGKPSMMNVPPPCWKPAHAEAVARSESRCGSAAKSQKPVRKKRVEVRRRAVKRAEESRGKQTRGSCEGRGGEGLRRRSMAVVRICMTRSIGQCSPSCATTRSDSRSTRRLLSTATKQERQPEPQLEPEICCGVWVTCIMTRSVSCFGWRREAGPRAASRRSWPIDRWITPAPRREGCSAPFGS